MKKRVCALLIFCLGVFNVGFAGERSSFHIASIAPAPGLIVTPVFNLSSAQLFGITEVDLIAIGTDNQPSQISDILKNVIHYLNKFDDDDLVLVVDGNTSLFIDGKESILNAFKAFDSDFVISASRCHPSVPAVDDFFENPPTFFALDASSFMGKVERVKKIFHRLQGHHHFHKDYNLGQLLTVDWEKHPKDYTLDRNADLFADLCGLNPFSNDIFIDNSSPYVQLNLQGVSGTPKVVNVESLPFYQDFDDGNSLMYGIIADSIGIPFFT